MNNKVKTLSKNTLLFTISNLGSKLISFLLVPLYTYYLSTADYGIVDIISTTVSLILPFLTLNIQDAVLRFSMDATNNPREVLNNGIKINILANVILLFMLSLLKMTGIIILGNLYMLLLWVLFFSTALNNLIVMYLKSINKVTPIVVNSIIHTILFCALNVFFLAIIKCGIYGYIISMIISNIIPLIYISVKGKIFKDFNFKKNYLMKEMIVYSLPLIINSISWTINDASGRYILSYMSGIEETGVYSIAYKIPSILSVFQTIFYSAWSISAIKEFDQNDNDGFIGKTYTFYSFMLTLCASFIIIFNLPLAKILYSREFFRAWKYVPFLVISVLFNGLALFESCLFIAVKKTKSVTISTLIGASTTLILNFILMKYYSGLGAAIAVMIGYSITWVVRTLQMKKIAKIKVAWNKNIISIILVIIQAIFATFAKFTFLEFMIIILLILLNYQLIKELINLILIRLKILKRN